MIKKTIYKISFFVALSMIPTAASATYGDCRYAGGSMWDCFWEAAGKDGNFIVYNGESNYKHKKVTKTELKELFKKRKAQCSKLAVKEQKSCLMKGLKLVPKLKKDSKVKFKTGAYLDKKVKGTSKNR